METTDKQLRVEHEHSSLIDFLLGARGIAGWLEEYGVGSYSPIPVILQRPPLEDQAAAA